jgi:hypothetical protein
MGTPEKGKTCYWAMQAEKKNAGRSRPFTVLLPPWQAAYQCFITSMADRMPILA